MKLRVERFDECSAIYDIESWQIGEHGELRLYNFKHQFGFVAVINAHSWSAMYDIDGEEQAKL